jgi:Protein of unknown function (DUF4056)
MKTVFEELESPYVNEQIHSRTPPDQPGVGLEYEIVTSPFVDSLEFREEEARTEPDEAEGPEEAEWEERVEESPEVELWTAETDETDLLESTHAIDEADDQELEELYGEPSTAAEEEEDLQFEQETYATLNRELKSLSLESRESSYEDRVEDKEEQDSGEEEQESCASDPEYELAVTEVEEEREYLEDFEEPEFSYETPLMAKAVTARPASSPPASCAERSTVNDAQSLKEPVPRPCCAFHPNLQPIGNQALDINDAAPHFYGENKYPHPEKSGFIYTCRGGFVDLGHSRDWLDWTGYLAVHAKALLPAGGTLELTCEFGSTRTVKFKAQGEKRSDEVCVYLAQRIAYQLAVWHEIVTSLLGHRYTAFSPEDNYSNLLGTYMGRDALMAFRKKSFNEAAALGIKSWLTKLGAVSQSQTMSAFNKVKDDWWKDVDLMTLNDLLLKRHFDAIGPVKPWLVPGVCSAASPFPLPVPNIVETPVRPGEKVKTDLKKLYVLELGTGPQVGPKLTGTKWDGNVHVTPDEFGELIQHVKTVL